MRGVYAYVCSSCRHLSSKHRLVPGASLPGPFRCPCGCEQTLEHDNLLTINRAQYEAGEGFEPLPPEAE